MYFLKSRPREDFAQSPSMARLKSSSSGLRLAFYPEHILWERELWSRLRDHIKQWLFVVNKAKAACRGPSHSLSPSLSCSLSCHSQPISSLPTIILDCQTNVRQCTTSPLYSIFYLYTKTINLAAQQTNIQIHHKQ